jgi:cell division protein FtsB
MRRRRSSSSSRPSARPCATSARSSSAARRRTSRRPRTPTSRPRRPGWATTARSCGGPPSRTGARPRRSSRSAEIDRRLAAIERPLGEVTARLDAAKAELDAAKRSLADAREGHTHRLAELDAEQKRKAREIAQAEGEIARRLVTLGTLVNLNRIEDPQFAELYGRIDRLRGAITARTTEIERLTAEREAYDRGNLVRGVATIGGAILTLIALIVILRAMLAR